MTIARRFSEAKAERRERSEDDPGLGALEEVIRRRALTEVGLGDVTTALWFAMATEQYAPAMLCNSVEWDEV